MDSTSTGNPGNPANEQPKSANSEGDKKPELPVISEPKGTDLPDGALKRSDSGKKDEEVQEKEKMLGYVQFNVDSFLLIGWTIRSFMLERILYLVFWCLD